MADTANAPINMEPIPAYPMTEQDEGAPEVLAQIVDDMEEEDDDEMAPSNGMVMMSPSGSGTFIPPVAPPMLMPVTDSSGGVHVRLTLSVGASGALIAPGLEIDDCGTCPFCLDKPKYGGPGTKRQKCELKQQEASFAAESRDTRVWASLHMVSAQEMEQMRQIAKLPLPEPLVKAIEIGPLPLVWAYRRKRRARTLPPAYVLMYYCEGRVPLDRSQLAVSRQRYFKNSRSDLAAQPEKNRAPRKPRLPRPRPTGSYGEPQAAHMQHMQQMYPQPGGPEQPQSAASQLVANYPHIAQDTRDPNMMHYQQMPPGMVMYPGQPYPQHPGAPSYQMVGPAYGHMPQHAPQYYDPHYAAYPPQQYAPYPPQPQMPPPGAYGQPPPEQAPPARGRKDRADPNAPPPGYYSHADPYADPYYTSTVPPPSYSGADMGAMGASAEAHAGAEGGKEPPPGEEDESDSAAMSNKTLELMLSRLQGQLPPATYEKVITLVRDVQCRRMSLSRSEFLKHFQDICSGQPRAH